MHDLFSLCILGRSREKHRPNSPPAMSVAEQQRTWCPFQPRAAEQANFPSSCRFCLTVFPIFRYTVGMLNRITINERGVITIPAKMRALLGIKPQDELIIENTEEGLLLRPAFSVPIEMYSEERISEFARDEDAVGEILPPAN